MPRKPSDIHYIYKTICLVTGRYYIGMHSTSNIDDGYLGSGLVLRRSIRKYGKENHSKEILEFLPDRYSLQIREKEIVTEITIKHELCMNLTPGGQGGFSIQQQIENGRRGNITQKMLIENNPEWVRKKFDKMSKKISEQYATGKRERKYFYDWNGKHHTEESKNKIGIKNSIHQKGEKNSQYGTCWITNNIENKKIKSDQIYLWIKLGWKKGRIIKL